MKTTVSIKCWGGRQQRLRTYVGFSGHWSLQDTRGRGILSPVSLVVDEMLWQDWGKSERGRMCPLVLWCRDSSWCFRASTNTSAPLGVWSRELNDSMFLRNCGMEKHGAASGSYFLYCNQPHTHTQCVCVCVCVCVCYTLCIGCAIAALSYYYYSINYYCIIKTSKTI